MYITQEFIDAPMLLTVWRKLGLDDRKTLEMHDSAQGVSRTTSESFPSSSLTRKGTID